MLSKVSLRLKLSDFINTEFEESVMNMINTIHKELSVSILLYLWFDEELNGLLDLPREAEHNRHAYYIYVVAHTDRDRIMEELTKKDIHLNISYPWPVHTMIGYEYLEFKCLEFWSTTLRCHCDAN